MSGLRNVLKQRVAKPTLSLHVVLWYYSSLNPASASDETSPRSKLAPQSIIAALQLSLYTCHTTSTAHTHSQHGTLFQSGLMQAGYC